MTTDPFDLNRFIKAQEVNYNDALAELKAGQKQSHWMWYIFPQFDGLAHSSTSKRYSIKSIEEAQAYLQHPVLAARLLECAEAVMAIEGRTAGQIFGSPDNSKLRSSVTLFATLSPAGSVFHRIIDKYFQGKADTATLDLLGNLKATKASLHGA